MDELAIELQVGVPTLEDIIKSLKAPNRDPRDEFDTPILKSDVLSIEDLKEGMKLSGTVRNVVDFGAFVDIGVKQDGLVHVSKLSKKFVKIQWILSVLVISLTFGFTVLTKIKTKYH